MSSGKLPLAKDVSAAAGPYVAKSFFRSLAGLLAIDIVVMLCFDGRLWQWAVLTGVEAVYLIVHIWRTGVAVKRVLEPMSTLTEAAESMKTSALEANDLRRLARKLERVQDPSVAERLAIPGSGKELAALAEAINAMLERIDRRYRAQVRFTNDASHELRTPLAVLTGYVDRLERRGKNNPEVMQQCIDTIRDVTEEMNRLVENLLFLARSDSNTQRFVVQELDLTRLVTVVAEETDMVDDDHQILTDIQEGVDCQADGDLIKQCLRILCDNALKYTPKGGSVTVGLRAQAGYAYISVTDTGMGIPEEDLPRVFERFYRTDESRNRATGGTGLGLSIASRIADCHCGRIDVHSKVGLGSKFTLVIPLTPPEPEAQEDAE